MAQNIYRRLRLPKPEVELKRLGNGKTTQTGIRNEVWSQEPGQGDKKRVWVTAEKYVPLIPI